MVLEVVLVLLVVELPPLMLQAAGALPGAVSLAPSDSLASLMFVVRFLRRTTRTTLRRRLGNGCFSTLKKGGQKEGGKSKMGHWVACDCGSCLLVVLLRLWPSCCVLWCGARVGFFLSFFFYIFFAHLTNFSRGRLTFEQRVFESQSTKKNKK